MIKELTQEILSYGYFVLNEDLTAFNEDGMEEFTFTKDDLFSTCIDKVIDGKVHLFSNETGMTLNVDVEDFKNKFTLDFMQEE